jgi:hypothetical protein
MTKKVKRLTGSPNPTPPKKKHQPSSQGKTDFGISNAQRKANDGKTISAAG